MTTAFVVYGRDVEAYSELSKFLTAVGIEQLTFDDVAATMAQPSFVADIVFAGLANADAVVVLLTPDELSIHFAPSAERFEGSGPDYVRWQARPNVIFEAGVALGAQRGNTILATLGADVSLFSDAAGLHTVRLDAPDGKRKLFTRLQKCIPGIREPTGHWESSNASGDFVRCRRVRWAPFDEVSHLMSELERDTVFEDGSLSVLDVLRKTVTTPRVREWRGKQPCDLCVSMERWWDRTVVDFVYWSLFVHGFFRPQNNEQFFHGTGNTWRQGAPYAIFAERGFCLIERLRAAAQQPVAAAAASRRR